MILVTGATGFIGGALCRDLAARGRRVAGTIRGDQAGRLPPAIAARRIADLVEDDPWRDALAGIEVVVHLAGRAHVGERAGGNGAAAQRINCVASRRLAERAVAAGVRRLVFVSTAKVHGEATSSRPWREDDAPGAADPYAESKWSAERAVNEIARDGRLEVVVLRPPLVYGPGVKANFLALLALCDSPWPLPLGGLAGNRRSLVYLGNLVAAVRLAIDHPAAAGRTYFVADDDAVSTARLARRLRAALGRPARLAPVPPGALRLAGRVVGQASAIDRLIESLELDTTRIKSELGWQPPFGIDHGLAATAAWYRARRES
jgi:nucleoside-diphosphate-sugar epimerase